jgi:hypothetical protein
MSFWTESAMEPKRNFRFQVHLGTGATSVLWWAKTVTTPAFDVSEVEHNFLDNKYYFPGRVSWNEVSLTLVDPISVDAVSETNKLLVDSGYMVKGLTNATSDGTAKTISKKKANAAGLSNLHIEILNAEGVVIEKWSLNNPFIKSAKYGDLDYSSDDLRTVELTIRYDWASCDTSGGSGANSKTGYFTKE